LESARESQNRDAGADREGQQNAATDARAIYNYIPEFHGSAGREILAGFQQHSENEHGKTCGDPPPAISESDGR